LGGFPAGRGARRYDSDQDGLFLRHLNMRVDDKQQRRPGRLAERYLTILVIAVVLVEYAHRQGIAKDAHGFVE